MTGECVRRVHEVNASSTFAVKFGLSQSAQGASLRNLARRCSRGRRLWLVGHGRRLSRAQRREIEQTVHVRAQHARMLLENVERQEVGEIAQGECALLTSPVVPVKSARPEQVSSAIRGP